jgi:hypothetical protein
MRPSRHVPISIRLAAAVAVIGCVLAHVTSAVAQDAYGYGPPIEEYVQGAKNAKIVPAGQLRLDGHKATCGTRSTVLDPNLDDYGAAYPGYLILNPKLLATVPTVVKLWIHAHECGHQFRGPDEEKADCFAVQRGRRQKWLTVDGLEQICSFIKPARGDAMHFSGSHRCELMRRCYANPDVE